VSTAVSDIPVAEGSPAQGEVLSADLQKVGAALTEYSKVDAGLAELRKTYGAVIYDVKTTAGMDAARKARLAVREPRYRVEEIRKSAKAPLLALGKQIDGEAKRITAALLEIETPIDEQIRAEETRRETERKAKEDAERARVLAIQTKLAKLQSLPEAYTSALAPAKLAEIITQLEAGLTFDYQEFSDAAEALRQFALVALRQAHVEAIEREEQEAAAEAARAAEEARLSAERAAEAARIAAEQAAAEERLREERAKLEAEQAAQRRNAEIDQRIRALSGPAHLTATDSPLLIDQAVAQLADATLTEADYGERLAEAQEARKAGVTRLQALWKAALAHKEEQERLARQRAEQEELARAQAEREAEIARREREQEAAEAERKWLAEQEAQKEAERKAEADRIERERQEREAEQARRRGEIIARLSKMTAEDIVRWIASELGCEWSIVAARLAEIPRKEWLALTHEVAK
jgi:hypothetical protein